MKKPKKRPPGRPRVASTTVTMNFMDKDLARATAWGRKQDPPLTCTAAIRRIVQLFFEGNQK